MLLSHILVIIMLWVGFWLRKGFWWRGENGRKIAVYFEKTVCFYKTLLWRFTEN